MHADDRFVTLRGSRFHFLEWSADRPDVMVALHGAMSQAHQWELLAHAVGGRCRLLALDQRGHGLSDWADDYSFPLLADDLAAFVDELALPEFDLIGHSMGGRIAMLYAGTHPDRVRRLVLVDIGPDTPAAAPVRLDGSFASIAEAVAEQTSLRGAAPPAEILQHSFRQREDGRWVRRCDPDLMVKRQPLVPSQYWSALRSITAPTLVVRGEHSAMLSRETAQKMVAALRRGTLIEIPGTGHSLWCEQPAEFHAAVTSFLFA